jgi:serine protease Do
MSTPSRHIHDAGDGAPLHAFIEYLSGPLRGCSISIAEAELHFAERSGTLLMPGDVRHSPHPIVLRRSGPRYELVASKHRAVWVNNDSVNAHVLESGDLIELEGGPVFRFRMEASGASLGRPPKEISAASVNAAQGWWIRLWGQAQRLVTTGPHHLVARAWHRSRVSVLIGLAGLIGAVSYLALQTHDLERQLVHEQKRVSGLAQLLSKLEGQALTRNELSVLRDELGKGLIDTGERVKVLETSSAAAGQIIARSSGSVALVHGSFGFRDPSTKRLLRFAVAQDGSPVRTPDGRPLMTLEGSGPQVEVRFGGTAFVAAGDGVLLTNRHIALPWEGEASLPAVRALGLEPVMHRMRGYLPGTTESFDIKLLAASDTQDLAILQGDGAAREATPLPLSTSPPTPGEAAVLLGFPTGIRALLARAGDAFVEKLSSKAQVDVDQAMIELARAGLIKPLASRGIVGQVSGEAIIYDAQTTSGGSGGPVFNLTGDVMAINRATLPEFGGSNIGVPARHALELMQKLKVSPEDRQHTAAR